MYPLLICSPGGWETRNLFYYYLFSDIRSIVRFRNKKLDILVKIKAAAVKVLTSEAIVISPL